MRIVYLLAGPGMSEQEKKRREAILNSIASTDTTIEVRDVEEGPKSIENAMDEYLALPNVLKFILRHQEEYDAVILGCGGDAGLAGAREQAKIPIIGPGESSLLLGTIGDRFFSIVTISAERAATKRRMVREAGFDVNRLVSSHALGIPVLELYNDKRKTQRAIIHAMKEAKVKGADVMLLGCMSVAFMERELLREAMDEAALQLINPVVTSVKMAEALVAMRNCM